VSREPAARIDRLLANLGYGSRREVQALIARGAVTLDGERLSDTGLRVPLGDALTDRINVRGQPLDPPAPLTLVMNKPLGLVCSHREPGRSIYELLPPRWQARDPALSSIGRLDVDTTGLLLITDDGPFLHRVISPKAGIAKRYVFALAAPLTGREGDLFASGKLMLEGETTPLLPAELEIFGPNSGALTIREGRYHQVRRMFAAAGNRVVELHRDRIGAFALPDALRSGEWRRLRPEESSMLFER
jgi:16S rRNA pseudouridine516 synthase